MDINEESLEEEFPLIDEVPTLPGVANAAVPAGKQNAETAKTAGPNHPADNSAVYDAQMQSLAAPHLPIPVFNAVHTATVTALSTVESVVPQRGGAQRYDLRPFPKASTRDAVLVIAVLILLLPLAAGSSPILPLGRVSRNNKNTLNYWASTGNVLTWAALIVPLILALIKLIRLIVKSF